MSFAAIGHFEILECFDDWRLLCWEPKLTGWAVKRFATSEEALAAMDEEHKRLLAAPPRAVVYFIGTELRVGRPVKIGFTENLAQRLRNLQTASPQPLQVLATVAGTPALERAYHRRWRARRTSGEWFTLGDCIIAEIKRLNGVSPIPERQLLPA